VDRSTGEIAGNKMRAADIADNGTIWKQILSDTDFAEYIKKKYTLVSGNLVSEDEQQPINVESDDE
jgi:hypothetical protein